MEVSERKHLTSREVERLIEATKGGRNEIRDRCLLLLMFRHGLRVSEACGRELIMATEDKFSDRADPRETAPIRFSSSFAPPFGKQAQLNLPTVHDRAGYRCW